MSSNVRSVQKGAGWRVCASTTGCGNFHAFLREAFIQQANSPNRYNKGYIENTRSTNCFASRIIWLCRGEEITKGWVASLSALTQKENLVNLHHKKKDLCCCKRGLFNTSWRNSSLTMNVPHSLHVFFLAFTLAWHGNLLWCKLLRQRSPMNPRSLLFRFYQNLCDKRCFHISTYLWFDRGFTFPLFPAMFNWFLKESRRWLSYPL